MIPPLPSLRSLASLLSLLTLSHAQPAFLGAEGAAANATGGRGGSVFIVTTLDKDGPGSFADAVSKPDRIIVFAVSGIIDLTERKNGQIKSGGKLVLNQPNLTIAGQTAPGDGICFKGGSLTVNASNIILRHLRVRRGFVIESDSGDSIELNPKDPAYVKPKFKGTDKDKVKENKAAGAELKPVTDVLYDHISASWATDENFTLSGHIDRVHAQYCFATEALDYTNPKQTPPNHAYGSLFGGAGADTRVGMHHSIFAHHRRRTPQCSAGDGSGDPPVVIDFRNNIVYNSIEALSHTGGHPIRLNFIANYYKTGPSSAEELRGKWFTMKKGNDESILHAAGNFIYGSPEATADNWKGLLYSEKIEFRPSMKRDQTFDVPPVTTHSAEEAFEINLDQAGATLPSRDAVDTRVAREIRSGTGKVIEKEGPYPAYHSLPALPDADHDGMPDFWEQQFALNKDDATDAMKLSANGYANLEHYLNNTDPRGEKAPIAFVSAQDGSFRLWHSGSTAEPLTVRYRLGTQEAQITIPAGKTFATLTPPAAHGQQVLTLLGERIGCPSRALLVTP